MVTNDGVPVATYDLGGAGPLLLLVHATGFHGRVWLPVAARLADRFHCWSLDLRGHGDSGAAPGADYDWHGFGRDILAVAAMLASGDDGGGVRAVGHSCGGASVLIAEEARPGTFAGLYCYEPVIPLSADGRPADPSGADLLADGARHRRQVFDSRAAARANYAAKAPFDEFDPEVLDAYVEWGFHDRPDGRVELACRGEDEARVYESGWRNDAYERLGRVACPVAVVSGDAESLFGIDLSRAMAGRLEPPALVDVIDGAGHFWPLAQPAAVAASVGDAFDRLGAFEHLGDPGGSESG